MVILISLMFAVVVQLVFRTIAWARSAGGKSQGSPATLLYVLLNAVVAPFIYVWAVGGKNKLTEMGEMQLQLLGIAFVFLVPFVVSWGLDMVTKGISVLMKRR